MAKFEIEYELKANVSTFKKEFKTVTGTIDSVSKAGKALDKSLTGIDNVTKERGLSKFFINANKTAVDLKATMKELNAELNKAGKDRSTARINMLRQSVAAGKSQYASQVVQGAAMADPAENLTSARYALYDMANEARRVSLALIGVGAASLKVAVDFERAFVDVKRVTGVTGEAMNQLREDLVDISTSSSISFTEVAKLATLGAQMGISANNIASFAETVAKFSAVTGVSVDTASASFGRIAQLLNLSSSEYEKLASAILYTGNRSVATESEILAVTTQIAASAEQAGFAADEVVGLSTALASLKIPPEMSRGVILRLFSDFDKVVAEGGQQLSDFGVLMGLTRDQTAKLWENDPSKFFTKFTASLGSASGSAAEMNVALNALGIVETREIATLQRLAGAPELVAKSMKDAGIAMEEGTEVNKQFGQVSETVSEKLKKLQNSIQALADSNLAGVLSPLAAVIDVISGTLTKLSKTPVVGVFLGIVTAVAGAIGVFGLYKAALFQASASLMAFKLTQQQLATNSALTAISLRSVAQEFIAITMGSRAAKPAVDGLTSSLAGATIGTRALSVAMKALPIIGWVSAGIALFSMLADTTDAIEEQTKALEKNYDAKTKVADLDIFTGDSGQALFEVGASNLGEFQTNIKLLQESFGEFGFAFSQAKGKFDEWDQVLSAMAANGSGDKAVAIFEQMKVEALAMGYPIKELTALFPQFQSAVESMPPSLENMGLAELSVIENSEELSSVISGKLNRALSEGPNKMASFADAAENFALALIESEGSIDPFTEAGRGALSTLSALFEEISKYNGNDVIGTLQMTAGAIRHVEQSGGDASMQVGGLVTLLNEQFNLKLNPTVITSFSQLQAAIAATGIVSQNVKKQIADILDGGAFTRYLAAVSRATSKTNSEAKKQVRTLKDYASDLKGVFDRILEFKFTKQKGLIAFKNTIAEIEKRAKDARRSIMNLQNQVAGKTSERTDLQFELSIATQFGDTAAMQDLSRQIAVLDNEISQAQEDIAYNTDLATGSLDMNTQAGRDNLATIQDLVAGGVDYVAGLATITSDQKVLTTALEETKRGVEETLRAMGLSEADIIKYTKPFEEVGIAIKNVKPEVTVTFKAGMSDADRALTEFKAKTEKTKVTIGVTASFPSYNEFLAQEKALRRAALVKEIARLEGVRDKLPNFGGLRTPYNNLITNMKDSLASGAYAAGGLVKGPGSGTSDSISARLSNGEFVMRASAVRAYGVDFMNSLNEQRGVPMSMSNMTATSNPANGGAQMVYLSPEDRKLLQDATNRPVALYTSNRVIAETANAGNVELARRGRN